MVSDLIGSGAKLTVLFDIYRSVVFPSTFEMIFELILLLSKSGLLYHHQILRLLHCFTVETCGYVARVLPV